MHPTPYIRLDWSSKRNEIWDSEFQISSQFCHGCSSIGPQTNTHLQTDMWEAWPQRTGAGWVPPFMSGLAWCYHPAQAIQNERPWLHRVVGSETPMAQYDTWLHRGQHRFCAPGWYGKPKTCSLWIFGWTQAYGGVRSFAKIHQKLENCE